MKTIFSLISVLFFSIVLLNCNPDNRIKDLEKQLEASNKLLAEYKNVDSTEGIAFKTKTKNSQRLKVKYYFKYGIIAEQIIDFIQSDTDYKLQCFLVGCNGEKHEKIEFYAIEDLAGTIQTIIPPDDQPHPIKVEQPGSSPQQPRPIIEFTISKKDPCTPPKTGIIKMAPRAVYTVEMN